MLFEFSSKQLKALYIEEKGAKKYEPAVVHAFFEVMSIIDAAQSTQDLYAQKSLRYEKLKGKRGKAEHRSLRLNDQWRLIVTEETDEDGQYLLIHKIEDYH
ncbi:MAG: type II toxin-antitoxin system RelE/ParE family toxin [Candidatus Nanopelagicaceae bacterium]